MLGVGSGSWCNLLFGGKNMVQPIIWREERSPERAKMAGRYYLRERKSSAGENPPTSIRAAADNPPQNPQAAATPHEQEPWP